MDYKKAVENVMADPRYRKNIEFGEPRAGHPEGKVKFHIVELDSNLERMKKHLLEKNEYWKLKFLIHVHDTFKAKATKGVPATDPLSHESLAREFASEFINDLDMLTIIQYHDESYYLWKQFIGTGKYDNEYFMYLLSTIEDWNLYLTFTIIDGHTKGKDLEKLPWFIREVQQYKETRVTDSWILK